MAADNLTHSANLTFTETLGDHGSKNLTHSLNFTFIEPLGDPGSTNLTHSSSLGRYVFGSEISYNKAPPRLPGLGC